MQTLHDVLKKSGRLEMYAPFQLREHKQKLLDFLGGFPDNGHEPDGFKATVRGNHLDNAMGDSGACGEKVVTFTRPDGKKMTFNFSTLIALAAHR